ncbi:MAG: hypothetical protein V3R72_13460, partial [Gammaproteobacteria bacterium]
AVDRRQQAKAIYDDAVDRRQQAKAIYERVERADLWLLKFRPPAESGMATPTALWVAWRCSDSIKFEAVHGGDT